MSPFHTPQLSAYFQEVSEVENEKGKFDYEKALDAISADREPGSLMDVENTFSTWLNELGEVEELSDEQFAEILERFDPKNTNQIGAKQIEAFCSGETWDMERKVQTVTKTQRKKVKKPKSEKKAKSPRRGSAKKNKSYLSDDSDDDSDDDWSDSEEDQDDEDEDSDHDDYDDHDDEFYGSRKKSKSRYRSDDDIDDDDDDFDNSDDDLDDDDFISSPIRKSKKKITSSSESDELVRDIAKALSSSHRSLRSSGRGTEGPSSSDYPLDSTGIFVDHTSKHRTHTEDMERSREVGRSAVSYLDDHGVSTPKWIRSVLKVGRGKEGFDNDDDDDDDDFGGVDFGSKRISRSPLKSKKKGRRGRRRRGAYSDDDDSDW